MVDPHISNKDVVGGRDRKWSISSSSVSAAAVYISSALVTVAVLDQGASDQMTRYISITVLRYNSIQDRL